jgi:hypothetical protein
MKLLIAVVFFVLSLFFNPQLARAEGEFSASYNVKYVIDEAGMTNVNEKVTLKNNTDKFFPSSFGLLISATNIDNVTASDADGPLEVNIEKQGKKSQIFVKFTKQIGGKDKQYSFDLNFNSPDFVQKNGDITTVSVPKVGSAEEVDTYVLNLNVPVSLGDPSFMTPEPKNQSENGGRLIYSFSKDQLVQSGVLGIFGNNQTFDFALSYDLENQTILPKVESIGIPAPSAFQQILIKNIDPKPDQVSVDEDGNYRAFFRMNRREKKKVTVNGLAKVNVVPDKKFSPLSRALETELTTGKTNWDAGNPQIRIKAEELITPEDKTIDQKMRKLYKYVVSTLRFDYARLEENKFEHLGAMTVMSNPDKAMSSEYTDLLIALARSAGIPTRQVIGVVFSNNLELRPLSFNGKNLHSWVEYYDEEGRWKSVDPTWESTSGGVDYFSQSLINHLAVAKRGTSSSEPIVPQDAVITFTDQKLVEEKKVNIYLEVQDTLYSGFPQQARLRIENFGNISYPKGVLTLSSKQIKFIQGEDKEGVNQITTNIAEIPPFGNIEMLIDIKTGTLTETYQDFILVGFANQVYFKEVNIVPFYKSPILLFSAIGIVVSMIAFYILVLGLHLRIGHDGIKFIHYKKKTDS